jgi:hypothetical protein
METTLSMMQNPAMQQMMQQMLSNPAFIDQVRGTSARDIESHGLSSFEGPFTSCLTRPFFLFYIVDGGVEPHDAPDAGHQPGHAQYDDQPAVRAAGRTHAPLSPFLLL